jgi:hypothetical protein
MAKKRRRPKVKFDPTDFPFGALAPPRKPRAGRTGRKGKWSKFGS